MRPIHILCVCDLGGATSALLAQYLHEILEEQGYEAETDEASLVCVSEKLADSVGILSPLLYLFKGRSPSLCLMQVSFLWDSIKMNSFLT